MQFETTTCITKVHRELLTYYAEIFNISVTDLITSLIHYAALCNKRNPKTFKGIQYRKRYKDEWKRIHLYVRYQEYEFLLDMKKMWKMSVALLIEYCIENVLEEFVKRLLQEDDTYSYRFTNYTFKFEKIYGFQSYQIIWGLPPEIMEKT
ncbi:MAG TPA: hypothetical protein PLO73_07030 [Spirochaetota bacterium]|nr:hypothetical protein [Spirochaetota bacterium]